MRDPLTGNSEREKRGISLYGSSFWGIWRGALLLRALKVMKRRP